jgi:hypothetical protein
MKLAALLWAALPLPAFAQYTLYACGSSSKDYVVGAKLPASGIFVRPADGEWRHAGFNHPVITAFDFDPRDPSVVYGPVYKTTYMRREYAVRSDQGGTLQPIQVHSWDVTWSVPDPRGVQNTFFTLNPHSSLRELETYFTFPPDVGISGVVSSKKSYDSPDKFVGGSSYEQIFQDRDTIIALYDIAPGARFPHINGFFSKDLADVVEDPSGWIFVRGGGALIACRPLQPYSWKPIEGGGRRLFSPYLQNESSCRSPRAANSPISRHSDEPSLHSRWNSPRRVRRRPVFVPYAERCSSSRTASRPLTTPAGRSSADRSSKRRRTRRC